MEYFVVNICSDLQLHFGYRQQPWSSGIQERANHNGHWKKNHNQTKLISGEESRGLCGRRRIGQEVSVSEWISLSLADGSGWSCNRVHTSSVLLLCWQILNSIVLCTLIVYTDKRCTVQYFVYVSQGSKSQWPAGSCLLCLFREGNCEDTHQAIRMLNHDQAGTLRSILERCSDRAYPSVQITIL